jgi:hypothetical protein
MLRIVQAKPNPVGKAAAWAGGVRAEQVLSEWVDVKNIGVSPVQIATICLGHLPINGQTKEILLAQTRVYWQGEGSTVLNPNKVLRVFTGRRQDQAVVALEVCGTDLIEFADQPGFVLDAWGAEILVVTWQTWRNEIRMDKAYYRPRPPEGVVLRRVEEELVCPD